MSLVYLEPEHQSLIDHILVLNQEGLNSRQIADHLNELGVTSWTGKRFYPELVFGVIRKARERVRRVVVAAMDVPQIRLQQLKTNQIRIGKLGVAISNSILHQRMD